MVADRLQPDRLPAASIARTRYVWVDAADNPLSPKLELPAVAGRIELSLSISFYNLTINSI